MIFVGLGILGQAGQSRRTGRLHHTTTLEFSTTEMSAVVCILARSCIDWALRSVNFGKRAALLTAAADRGAAVVRMARVATDAGHATPRWCRTIEQLAGGFEVACLEALVESAVD